MNGDQHADAVRIVEDAIDAHSLSVGSGCVYLDGGTGEAVVDALIEAGWTLPDTRGASRVTRPRTVDGGPRIDRQQRGARRSGASS